MSAFKDHFSGMAAAYREFRPSYLPELFAYLASLVSEHQLAWDAGTGNGQAAVELAKQFDRVIATDASAEQLKQAEPHPKLEYRVATAEASGLDAASVDLACVAQALHWFDVERYYAEVRRVVKPGGVLAAIGYSHHRVNPEIDRILDRYEGDFVGACWPPERRLLEAGFRTLPFPFRERQPPPFQLTATMTAAEHLGYLRTWSATKEFVRIHGVDPASQFADEFARAWGDGERTVTWRLHLRVGIVEG